MPIRLFRALLVAGAAMLTPAHAASAQAADRLAPLVAAFAARHHPTAIVVLKDGATLASIGDPARKVDVASVRKSLLGALIGIAAGKGQIRTDATLAALGINDIAPALTDTETAATVDDLLTARSGVYHPAVHETAAMREARPARGSHSPGSFWFYNNWDFNALGGIWRQATGEDLFASFARDIAAPAGMTDFVPTDGRMIPGPASRFPYYDVRLSARDAARFGELYLDGGRAGSRQVVPADWVRRSTVRHADTGRGGLGYGYLWWTLPAATFGPGAATAAGHGGEYITILPAERMVVVETVDRTAGGHVPPHAYYRLLAAIVAAARG